MHVIEVLWACVCDKVFKSNILKVYPNFRYFADSRIEVKHFFFDYAEIFFCGRGDFLDK